jgi:hypothetical protein
MDRILEELARHTDDATRPDVDVYLASGPVLRGRLMRVQQGLATLHLANDASVAYVRVEQIIAVTVTEGPRLPSHHDDIITPVNEMSLAAMQAAMSTPTPPEVLAPHHEDRASRRSSDEMRRSSSDLSRVEKARVDKARAEISRAELARAEVARSTAHRGDDVSAAFSAMRVDTGSVPAPDPIAEFVASQYDVITPPDPIEPPSLHFGQPMHGEAPTYLGDRPQRPKTPSPAATISPAAVAAAATNIAAAETTFPMRGDTPKPKTGRTPAPSRPELMRQANTHAEMMSRVLKHRIDIAIAAPLDDDARRAIGFALPIASDVLLAMAGEPKHRAILDQIVQVELVAGEAEVLFDGPRLVIRCSLVDRFTPASLRAALEAGV